MSVEASTDVQESPVPSAGKRSSMFEFPSPLAWALTAGALGIGSAVVGGSESVPTLLGGVISAALLINGLAAFAMRSRGWKVFVCLLGFASAMIALMALGAPGLPVLARLLLLLQLGALLIPVTRLLTERLSGARRERWRRRLLVLGACLVGMEAILSWRRPDLDPPFWRNPFFREPSPRLSWTHRPGITEQSNFSDNPRGYFAEEGRAGVVDMRAFSEYAVNGSAISIVRATTADGVLHMDVETERGAIPEHARVFQSNYRIEADREHVISFRARASEPRDILVTLSQAELPYTLLGLRQFVPLTTEWTAYRYAFTSPSSDPNCLLSFMVASGRNWIELTDVRIDLETGDEWMARNRFVVQHAINSEGFRTPLTSPAKPAGRRRVVVIGGGLAVGVGVHDWDTFVRRCERQWNQNGGNVEVINLAVIDYGVTEMRRCLEAVALAYRPDVVLCVLSAESGWEPGALRGRSGMRPSSLFWRWTLDCFADPDKQFHNSGVLDLQGMSRFCQEHQIGFVVGVAWHCAGSKGPRFLRQVREALVDPATPVVDLGSSLNAVADVGSLYAHWTLDETHLNERAHQIIADELLREPSLVSPAAPAPR